MGRLTDQNRKRKPKPTPAPPAPHASSSAPGLKIKRVPIGSIHVDPNNANRHTSRNLEAIDASLKAFGQVEPLIVQRSTGKVIGGNGRLDVLKAAGATEVDVVEVDLTDERAAALGLALNRTPRLSHLDEDAVAGILRDLPAELQGAAGWNPEELVEALNAGFVHVSAAGGVASPAKVEPIGLRQMSFILTDAQADAVAAALSRAKKAGPFTGTGNENENGNALARIAEAFTTHTPANHAPRNSKRSRTSTAPLARGGTASIAGLHGVR